MRELNIKIGYFGVESQSIVCGIDVKKTFLRATTSFLITQKKRNTNLSPLSFALELQSLGAGEIFLNSVNSDGRLPFRLQYHEFDNLFSLSFSRTLSATALAWRLEFADATIM